MDAAPATQLRGSFWSRHSPKEGSTQCRGQLVNRSTDHEDSHTVAIDWVKAGIANLGIDIGHLLASPMTWLEVTPDEAADLRDAILAAYVVGLAEAGWSGNGDEVKYIYLTRLACEAIRNTNLLARSISSPEWNAMMERFVGQPIEAIATHYRQMRAFCIACAEEARHVAQHLT